MNDELAASLQRMNDMLLACICTVNTATGKIVDRESACPVHGTNKKENDEEVH